MEKEINKTGYPHIDRPWMKWYTGAEYDMFLPDTNITDYLRMKNVGRDNIIAELYYGTKITYAELFAKSDEASKALTAIGVGKGKSIINLMPNIPETGQIWLGASQIGAICDFADPRPDSIYLRANALKLLELIRYEKADYIVALDKCYLGMIKPIENELKELGIENVIIVSASDSMNILGVIDYLSDVLKYNKIKNKKLEAEAKKGLRFYQTLYKKLMEMSKEKELLQQAISKSPFEIIKYKDLVRESQRTSFTEIKDGSLVNYIGHTSGTSGARPKPIPLTNHNHIFSTEQTFKAGANVNVAERAIHELPFFSPLGADNNFILDLASGATLIDVPEFEINEFGFLLKKYRPSAIMGTPSWFSQLHKCPYIQHDNLSYLNRVIYGGDSMSAEDESELNEWLHSHGSKAIVEKGHGMSEFCGGGSYAFKKYNKYNSIGIPFPDTIYGIVDPNVEDKLVPVNKVDEDGMISGELIVSTEALTPGVLNGNVIVQRYELDGKEYIRTRDLVKMDKDGIFYFEARKDRSFTRYDGYKVKPSEIEKEIEKHPNVRYCKIVHYNDDTKNGFMPIAHIVLEDDVVINNDEDYEGIVREIIYEQIIGNPIMSTRQIPSKFKFRASLPLTKNSKIDFNALVREEIDGTEISVNVSETNLSVSNIEITSPSVMKLSKKNK